MSLRLYLCNHVIECQVARLCFNLGDKILADIERLEIIVVTHDLISQTLKFLCLLVNHILQELLKVLSLVELEKLLFIDLLLGFFLNPILKAIEESQCVQIHPCSGVEIDADVSQLKVNFLNVLLDYIDDKPEVVGVLTSINAILLEYQVILLELYLVLILLCSLIETLFELLVEFFQEHLPDALLRIFNSLQGLG